MKIKLAAAWRGSRKSGGAKPPPCRRTFKIPTVQCRDTSKMTSSSSFTAGETPGTRHSRLPMTAISRRGRTDRSGLMRPSVSSFIQQAARWCHERAASDARSVPRHLRRRHAQPGVQMMTVPRLLSCHRSPIGNQC